MRPGRVLDGNGKVPKIAKLCGKNMRDSVRFGFFLEGVIRTLSDLSRIYVKEMLELKYSGIGIIFKLETFNEHRV